MKLSTFLWKAQRKFFGRYVGKLFYQPRIDKQGNLVRLRKFFGPINQRLTEAGKNLPWILTGQECIDFWSSVCNDPKYAGLRPDEYASKPGGIVQFLHEFWSPWVDLDNTILELGCNAGANLEYLRKLGYSNLLGIEVNQNAIDEMKMTFPELATKSKIYIGSLEDLLPGFATDSVDVIFSMAVALHIHPTSTFLFSEMARVARKYICTIELEAANCSYVFARNYRRLFQRLGCPQVKSVMITKEAFPSVSRKHDGYVARLFLTGQHGRKG